MRRRLLSSWLGPLIISGPSTTNPLFIALLVILELHLRWRWIAVLSQLSRCPQDTGRDRQVNRQWGVGFVGQQHRVPWRSVGQRPCFYCCITNLSKTRKNNKYLLSYIASIRQEFRSSLVDWFRLGISKVMVKVSAGVRHWKGHLGLQDRLWRSLTRMMSSWHSCWHRASPHWAFWGPVEWFQDVKMGFHQSKW